MRKFALLYVDDEESNLRIFKDTFRRKFDVYTAISAKEGIKILNNNQIDLVLSDQRMPEMSGVEFLEFTLEHFPGPKRILITGFADFDAIESAVNNARIFQYVQKPWDEEKLDKIIESALRVYHLEIENRKQKEELIVAKEKAEESNRLKTAFLNNLSHEIRTPMNAIVGFANLLSEFDITEEQRANFTQIIINNCSQLLNIVNDVLAISTIETSQETVSEQCVNINSLIIDLLNNFKNAQQHQNVAIYIKQFLGNRLSEVYTDKNKINRILTSFVSNALKFTHDGSVEIGYTLHSEPNQPLEIVFYVKDTGIGISPEYHDLIFDRFRQVDFVNTRKYGGMGLGLSISKGYVKLLGGKIWLESELGKGSIFYFSIPYKPVHVAEHVILETNYQILVAEDEEYNFLLIEELFLSLGYVSVHAKNGDEAVNICKENDKIALVLMDIKMPVLDGYSAAIFIREMKPDLPIIAVSAYALQHEINEYKTFFNDYITKPIDKNVLNAAIKKFLT